MAPTLGSPQTQELPRHARSDPGPAPSPRLERARRAERLLGWLLWMMLAGVVLWTGT